MSRVPSYMGVGAPSAHAKKLSTASTVVAIGVEDAGRLLLVGGNAGAQQILLPTPEFGLSFRFAFTVDAVGTATLVGGSSATIFDIIIIGSTGIAAQFGSTSEDGQVIEFIGLNDNRYLALPQALSSGAGGVWAAKTT